MQRLAYCATWGGQRQLALQTGSSSVETVELCPKSVAAVYQQAGEQQWEGTHSGLGWKSDLEVQRNSRYLHNYTHRYTDTMRVSQLLL